MSHPNKANHADKANDANNVEKPRRGEEAVKIDLEALFVAFSDDSVERSYYLDRDSGRVFNVLEDHDDPERKRHLYRLWHREAGDSSYDGIGFD